MSSQPFFERVPGRFEKVTISEDGINTFEFCQAAEGVVLLFDELGSTAFAPVKSDISGNIKKVLAKYNTDPKKFDTLQKIILSEAGSKDKTATQGLLWLKRGLDFCATALLSSINDVTEELKTSFSKAYEATLKRFHNFLIRPIFSLAMQACPSRDTFYKKLGADFETIKDELYIWCKALKEQVDTLSAFYASGNYDKGL
ncbi:hypothetical protein BB560_002729 [Smittium megazygosporum]|uniref:Glycolipid transfer protein domain-containing protein n=1 Tax=Smittium megazygosporum TaxID=133381 RepID=A0A2T9ZE39_9FUNG|nr:hypothetical protein BB560_002729 [Smittium megazygosporum]